MSEDQLAEGRKVNALVVLCGIMAIAGDMIGDVSSNPFRGGSSFNPRQKAKRKQRMKMSNRSKKRNRR